MFDFAWSELALIGVVAIVFIGPKDMPVAIKTVTGLIKKGRKLAAEFQTHVDEMVREANLTEVRDQFNDLRRFNVRSRIMGAIDQDGSIRNSLRDPTSSNAGAALDEVPVAALPSPPAARTYIPPSSASDRAWPATVTYDATSGEGDAPSILPPSLARRLSRDRPRLTPPACLPPVRVLHGNRRVSVTDGSDLPAQDKAHPAMGATDSN